MRAEGRNSFQIRRDDFTNLGSRILVRLRSYPIHHRQPDNQNPTLVNDRFYFVSQQLPDYLMRDDSKMSWNTELTGTALNIAKTSETRLRVVAGPGTGKSFALKRRVARLLEEGQDPTRILAVTFTRNAADSLVQDLTQLDVAGCEKVHVGTLFALES